MKFPEKEAYEAYRSCDASYDGSLFVGIRSTGIYCRPICPARRASAKNCRFFSSAAEAEAAGFRPCLICHPERPSFSASLLGTDSLAEKMAAYLWAHASGPLSLEGMAARFGYSSRHMRRVFMDQFHVAPITYLETCRLLLAKALLQGSSLSIAEIALASGFGSTRRLNELFQERYHLPPTALHRLASSQPALGTLTLTLTYRPPYLTAPLFAFLEGRAIKGIENVTHGIYERTVSLEGKNGEPCQGIISVAPTKKDDAFILTLSDTLLPVLSDVIFRVSRQFDLAAFPGNVAAVLCAMNDDFPGTFMEGIRIPGAFDGFETAVRAILGQQITVKAAGTLASRFVATLGTPIETGHPGLTHLFPTPNKILSYGEGLADELGKLGIISSRTAAIRALAQALVEGSLRLDGTRTREETKKALLSLKGIGHWTSDYIAMRVLKDPDIFLENDAGIKHAMPGTTPKKRLTLAEAWRPFRSYATVSLWR
ncbi:MAG: Ada metal-binding domain-containing protein [Acidaminococcus sp.]|uniref:DNA-3-methyladenine glycosylase II n=1 Tax=Acidaminococcus intestini TaxID=187327 RepID=A0A943EG88_9FIRM|nr:Ada metal-binding domain-containing protein [Acidaminococcus sp.]MBS5519556.1 helix-turn-helix domain-containing protein [Acidaminococcus intestini]MDY2739521.1 Ada metal-binding domain-containing protein [Acidaminococcus sp.]